MKHEPRPGDGQPVPRQTAKDSDARPVAPPADTTRPHRMPEIHHVLPAPTPAATPNDPPSA